MASEPVVVVRVGMMTAVGLSAAETAASVRSATMRFQESSFRDHRHEPVTLAGVPDDGVPPLRDDLEHQWLTNRERRTVCLATQPLLECVRSVPAGEPPPPLVLALSDRETRRPLKAEPFLRWLEAQTGGGFDVKASDAAHRGRAGGLAAIGRAADLLRSGRARFVVAGGVDSHRDAYVLARLDREKRVKSAAHLDGFIPGEGAGFVLLATRSAAAAAGLVPQAAVSPVVEAVEPGHLLGDEPYRGEGLAAAVGRLATSGTAPGPVQEVYSSMNGESYWAKEWGVALVRNSGAFAAQHRMHHPADCFGDTGAACGPLMLGLAALGIRDGYRRSPALVYASSDTGARAAVLVTAAS